MYIHLASRGLGIGSLHGSWKLIWNSPCQSTSGWFTAVTLFRDCLMMTKHSCTNTLECAFTTVACILKRYISTIITSSVCCLSFDILYFPIRFVLSRSRFKSLCLVFLLVAMGKTYGSTMLPRKCVQTIVLCTLTSWNML